MWGLREPPEGRAETKAEGKRCGTQSLHRHAVRSASLQKCAILSFVGKHEAGFVKPLSFLRTRRLLKSMADVRKSPPAMPVTETVITRCVACICSLMRRVRTSAHGRERSAFSSSRAPWLLWVCGRRSTEGPTMSRIWIFIPRLWC